MATPEQLNIRDEDLTPLAGKVVIVTGSSSGMGLAATKLLLDLNAKVIAADMNPSPIAHPNHTFIQTDVADWPSLRSLFKQANTLHSRIDHVFANAGMTPSADYFSANFDSEGELLEPTTRVYDVNLRGAVNTTYLALHYMQDQEPATGSIVVTSSASAVQRFRPIDYVAAKHGSLGLVRALTANLESRNIRSIRINSILPGWTATGMIPGDLLTKIEAPRQEAEVPARSALYLMAKGECRGQVVYSDDGKYWEVEEQVLLPAAASFVQQYPQDALLDKFYELSQRKGAE